MKSLRQSDYKMKIVKDLGVKKPNENSSYKKRYAIFECSKCKNTIEAMVSDVKKNKQDKCRKCSNIKHGMKETRLYKIWTGMKQRCYNKNNTGYIHYGGQDVTICNEWKDNFIEFHKWSIRKGYSEKLTIDRIDPYGNYSMENCRWITDREQSTNKRLQSNNKTGFKGISYSKLRNKYVAYIGVNGKTRNLGGFETAEEAHEARVEYIQYNCLPHTY